MDNLIGPDTVNTVPPATLDAFRDHGVVANTLAAGLDEAQAQLARLDELGIDLTAVTGQLLEEGVAAFAGSFDSLLAGVAAKRDRLEAQKRPLTAALGRYQAAVAAAMAELQDQAIIERIWAGDHTVWRPQPDEISNRLGWLRSPEMMRPEIGRLDALRTRAQAEGFTDVLLLGMGGSSLAPELFAKTFGAAGGGLNLQVLDSTDADAVRAKADSVDLARTLFIVATKSGGTVETLSFFKYFYNRVTAVVGADRAGAHFIAITDPGSKLEALAGRYSFRDVFLNDPNIGGRYSALSYFGLVPAALVGVDVAALLARAEKAAAHAAADRPLIRIITAAV